MIDMIHMLKHYKLGSITDQLLIKDTVKEIKELVREIKDTVREIKYTVREIMD